MKTIRESFIRLHRKPWESILLGVLMTGFIVLIVVLVLFSSMSWKMKETIYQGVDYSVRLDSEITTLKSIRYTNEIYADIEELTHYFNAATSREGVKNVSFHYTLTPQWKNGTKPLAITPKGNEEENQTKNGNGSLGFGMDKKVLLYGQTKKEQETIRLLHGRGFNDKEWQTVHQNAVAPKALLIWDGKSMRPIQVGDGLELYFPHPLENFQLDKGESLKGVSLTLTVIGTYETLEKKGAITLEDAKKEQRIYVSNALIKSWMDRLHKERNDLIYRSTGIQREYLERDDGTEDGAKILFPTLICDSLETLEREMASLRQLGYHLEKYDAQGNTVREYTTTSTIDQAKHLVETTKLVQATIFSLFAIATLLVIVLFVLIYFLFFKTRTKEMPLRLALGSTFSQMRRLFLLEKVWLVLLSGFPGFIMGLFFSKKIGASLCEKALRQQQGALILSDLTTIQQERITAIIRETYTVHLSAWMIAGLLLGIVFFLYVLTTWAMRRTMKRLGRLG